MKSSKKETLKRHSRNSQAIEDSDGEAILVTAAQLVCLPEYQMRIRVNKTTVDRYAKAYRSGAKFPPISVAVVSKRPIVVDGWHRLYAQQRNGQEKVKAIVVEATKHQALVMAAEANLRHGLQLRRSELLATFQAFVRAGRHKNGERLLSYRQLQELMGGQVAHTTIRNWMIEHFPRIAGQYSSDGVEGSRDRLRDDNAIALKLAKEAAEQIVSLVGGLDNPVQRGKAIAILEDALARLKGGGHWTRPIPNDDF